MLNAKIVNASKEMQTNTIEHELLHYIDYLIGHLKTKTYLSKQIDLKYFVDTLTILEPDYSLSKLVSIYKYKEIVAATDEDQVNITLIDYLFYRDANYNFRSLLSYYLTTEEIYVRYQLMKLHMVKLGIIPNMTTPIDKDTLLELMDNIDLLEKQRVDMEVYDYFSFLMILNWNKIEEIDKLLTI